MNDLITELRRIRRRRMHLIERIAIGMVVAGTLGVMGILAHLWFVAGAR